MTAAISRPLANQKVEVALTSERKKTTATRLALTSDEMGRIEGNYKWTEADVMDDYALAITGYKGSAKVALGRISQEQDQAQDRRQSRSRKAEADL